MSRKQVVLLVLLLTAIGVWSWAQETSSSQATKAASSEVPIPRASEQDSGPRPSGERVLQFPEDRSLGKLRIRDSGSEKRWRPYSGEPRGRVVIPAAQEAQLYIRREVEDGEDQHLRSFFTKLEPGHLQSLYVTGDRWEGIAFLTALQAGTVSSVEIRGARRTTWDNGKMKVTSSSLIDDADLLRIKEIPDVTVLKLNGSKITDAGLVHLEKMISLRVLEISGTKISDVGVLTLVKMKNLRELDIRDTQITAASLRTLSKMKNLRVLKINGLGITREGWDLLKKDLPDCRVSVWGGGAKSAPTPKPRPIS